MPTVSELISQILLKKLREEQLTLQESAMLAEWEGRSPEHAAFINMLMDEALLSDKIKKLLELDERTAWQGIERALAAEWNDGAIPKKRKISWYKYAAAASLIIILGFAVFYFVTKKPPVHKTSDANKQPTIVNKVPGSNKATLTLADGAVIDLGQHENGLVAGEGGSKVTKMKDSMLVYEHAGAVAQKPGLHNELSTPRGGRYQLKLEDGTKVWLNAGSTIKYPVSFSALSERKVEITGEAYFEVAKDAQKAFVVIVNPGKGKPKGEVQVTGTHFNIKAYEEEKIIATTLLEGKVRMVSYRANGGETSNAATDSRSLTTGQQVVLDEKGRLALNKKVNLNSVTAWKEALFDFQGEQMPAILREVARWYDIKLVYEGTPPRTTFTATLDRNKSLTEILKVLESSGYHFKMNGDTLMVLP